MRSEATTGTREPERPAVTTRAHAPLLEPTNGEGEAVQLAIDNSTPPPPDALQSTREPGRRGKQGETRARLIQVTIELVRREGLPALTTSRITKAAGIAQPGFYAHFKNVDELVQVAVLQVLEEMRVKIGETRRNAFGRFKEYADVINMHATRQAYADGVAVFLSDPTFAELYLRYRRDPSLLGGMMRYAHTLVRQEITEDIWRTAQRFGFKPEHYVQVSVWAEQILALFLWAAEALLDGRYGNRDQVLDSVALSSYAIMAANVRKAGLAELLPSRRST